MPKGKVLISTSTFGESDPTPIKTLEAAGFEVILNPFKRKLTRQESLNLLPDFDGLIAGLEILDKEVLEKSRLKVISRCGAGISNVDVQAAQAQGIKFFSTPDAPTNAVAELTIGAMLSLLRKIPQMNDQLHKGAWNKILGNQLEGKTVVIIGCGRIGLRVAEILKAFKAKILVVDPHVKNSHPDYKYVSIKEALPLADIISIHASGQQEIIGANEFSLIKPSAIILNVARGGVVNEQALLQALNQNKIAGAWIDTFVDEPYSGPLLSCPQVLLTPHVGSLTHECRQRMELEAAENLLQGFQELGLR